MEDIGFVEDEYVEAMLKFLEKELFFKLKADKLKGELYYDNSSMGWKDISC